MIGVRRFIARCGGYLFSYKPKRIMDLFNNMKGKRDMSDHRPYDFSIRFILTTLLCVLLLFASLFFVFHWETGSTVILILLIFFLCLIWFPYEKVIKKASVKNERL